MKPFFISIPHSGEQVPPEAPWLDGLPEPVLMCDVDRFVDVLYESPAESLQIPIVKTMWHRYACDLNRLPDDVDASTVKGHPNIAGSFRRGFLWSITTLNVPLMKDPVSTETHEVLIKKYFEPFHADVRAQYNSFFGMGFKKVYHLDAHSMPSVGTKEHRDPGQVRPEICVSDAKGTSCSEEFKDLVISSYEKAGFQVGYNWPYFGGRVTETYGRPEIGQHALQVEMSRSLYMDETTKQLKSALKPGIQQKIKDALGRILDGI